MRKPNRRVFGVTGTGENNIHPDRIRALNDKPIQRGKYVLYWMQQSQREHFNHALEYAALQANELELSLLVVFGLTSGFPEANLRHYHFMLEGLVETARSLTKRRIRFALQLGDPVEVALRAGRNAALIVCDRGYLRLQKQWRQELATRADSRVIQVESDVVVPVNTASDKREFSARALRPKLLRLRDKFLIPVATTRLKHSSLGLKIDRSSLTNIDTLCRRLQLDASVPPVTHWFRGGSARARRIFSSFLQRDLSDYKKHRNQPQTNNVSHMSKFLHFGQISPVWLVLEVQKQVKEGRQNVYTFIDELLVRRELAINFVEFTENYGRYNALPEWARATLEQHRSDTRPHLYSPRQLEAGATHDPYWNAAMREMRETGYMHNYMRMYWGKKILEWSADPEVAFHTALALNNKYFVDGRDPNGFANVAWIFGQHDRPWPEREVFGKVRYMNAAGLERKCDIGAYVAKVEALTARPTKRDSRA